MTDAMPMSCADETSVSPYVPTKDRDVRAEDEHIAMVNEEGQQIFDDYTKRMANDPAFAALGPQERYEYYVKTRYGFASANPFILRYIASFGMFSPKANWLYFKQCYQLPIKTDADYCARSADFIMYLYKMCTPLRGEALLQLREESRLTLEKELDERADAQAKAQAERIAYKESVMVARREAIKKQLASGKLAEVLANTSKIENNASEYTEPDRTSSDDDSGLDMPTL